MARVDLVNYEWNGWFVHFLAFLRREALHNNPGESGCGLCIRCLPQWRRSNGIHNELFHLMAAEDPPLLWTNSKRSFTRLGWLGIVRGKAALLRTNDQSHKYVSNGWVNHQISIMIYTQMLNVEYIYLHLPPKLPKCSKIGHTLSIWDMFSYVRVYRVSYSSAIWFLQPKGFSRGLPGQMM